jgi:hypothetical protein
MATEKDNSLSILFMDTDILVSQGDMPILHIPYNREAVTVSYKPEKDETTLTFAHKTITFFPSAGGYKSVTTARPED